MFSLELNIHQLILTDLANNVGDSSEQASDASLDSSINLVTSRVTTREVDNAVVDDEAALAAEKVFMVRC